MSHIEIINYYAQKGLSAKQIFEQLKDDDARNHPAYSTVTKHVRALRHNFPKRRSQKRSRKIRNFKFTQRIQRVVARAPTSSVRDIAQELSAPPSTVHYHLHNYLQYKSVPTRFVPHLLSDVQKRQRVALSKSLLPLLRKQREKNYRFFVTGDESWFYFKFIPKRVWVKEGEKGLSKPREKFSLKKVMICVFWGIDGIEYIEAKDSDESYNSQYFCNHIIDSLVASDRYTQAKTQKQKYVLHMDNSPVHNSKYTEKYLMEKGIYRPQHPVYSPDLAPSDFWLFGQLDNLKGNEEFETSDDIVSWIEDQFAFFSKDLIKSVFEDWERRLEKCIELNGDYI